MAPTTTPTGRVVGVLGGRWRATVTPGGRIEPWGSAPALDWWVAAEDRWHVPATEASVRQQCVDGTPVIETRVRIPGGDAIQRVYAVADAGGVTVIEVENDSPASIAVAFSHGSLLTVRPPAEVPIEGIELPSGAVVFPVGHHATVRLGLSHRGGAGVLPEGLPSALAVVRGWTRQVEQASRFVLPDPSIVERLVSARCQLALDGLADDREDAAAYLIGAGELVRMGGNPAELEADVVTVAERLARSARTCGLDWDGAVALEATEAVLAAAHDQRAAGDVAALRTRLGGAGAPRPVAEPAGIRIVPWLERSLAEPRSDGGCVLLPDGHPAGWLGANWEAYHLPAGPRSRISYAVRWHGERPAVLWEVEGEPVEVRGGPAAGGWHSADPRGEALWPAP